MDTDQKEAIGLTKLEPGARWWWQAPDDTAVEPGPVELVRKIEDGATALEDDAPKWVARHEIEDTEYDLYERELLPLPHTESPEKTGRYECPHCGNNATFYGDDAHAGATQRFTVDLDGHPDYEEYKAWGISDYTEIRCAECEGVVWPNPQALPWTVIMLCDDSDGQRQMYMDTARAPDAATAVEIVRDQAVESGNGWVESDIFDIITIPGEHNAVGPSQPWWK